MRRGFRVFQVALATALQRRPNPATMRAMPRRNPTAYHGSTASFTAFTVDGVGKGHGIGYGWGVYLTGDRATAAVYAGAGGHVYETKIPRGPWMPWTGRASSPTVRRAAKQVLASLRHVRWGDYPAGEEYYTRHAKAAFAFANGTLYLDVAALLCDDVGGETSRLLRSHGILGITYRQPVSILKDGSTVPEGATNYVVFDPKDIRVAAHRNPFTGYHGTGAKRAFSRFDPRKIVGRGSAGQHGWGVYLTDSDTVATSYARSRAGDSSGKTLRVHVDADDDDFIDWESPYTEQPQKIQRALQRLSKLNSAPGRMLRSMFKDMEDGSTAPEGWAGRQFYSVLHDAFTDASRSRDEGAGKKVSLWLAKGGIAGTKFPDHTDAQDGTATNYCVFDLRRLRIEGEA